MRPVIIEPEQVARMLVAADALPVDSKSRVVVVVSFFEEYLPAQRV